MVLTDEGIYSILSRSIQWNFSSMECLNCLWKDERQRAQCYILLNEAHAM